MNLANLIIIGIGASFIIYFISRLNWRLGTIIQTLFYLGTGYYLYTKGTGSVSKLEIFSGFDLSFNVSNYNILFILLGIGVMFLISLFSINSLKIQNYKASFNFLNTLVFISILGVFGADNFLTLFIFWELMTWTSFFLISMGKKFSKKAALLYLFMSMISAYLMLSGIFMIQKEIGGLNFSLLIDNYQALSGAFRLKILFLFGIAGLIKGGVYPLHIWMRTTYSESPDLFTSVLSGILMKFGFYLIYIIGIFFPVFSIIKGSTVEYATSLPSSTIISYLAGLSIIVGTVAAILQNDAKKLIAFSSVSHAGYILLAFAYGTNIAIAGGLTHIVVHALTALGMFLSIGAVYYRTGTTKMDELGGLITSMPVSFTTYLISIISLAGIPPLFGFVSKWMIYQSLIQNGSYFLAFAAFFGSIGSFMYVFRPLATVFLGQKPKRFKNVKEVPFFMQLSMLLITGITILFGVLPGLIVKPIINLQKSIGIEPIKVSLYKLFSSLTTLDMFLVFNVFGGGFIVALIVFLSFSKATKVKQHEQYTAGEIVPELKTTPSIYHYSKNYYKPFSRIFNIFPSLEDYYRKTAYFITKIFKILEEFFYSENINGYIWIISFTFLLIIILRWF